MKLIDKAIHEFNRVAPLIMAVGSAIGVGITVYEAIKETPKAIKLLEEAESEKGEPLTTIETVKTAAPAFKKTAVAATSTVAIIAGNHILNQKQQLAIMGLCKAANTAYTDYQNKTKELYGEEAHEKIVNAIAAEKANGGHINAECLMGNTCLDFEEASPDEHRLFFIPNEHRFFDSTIEKVIQAEYHLNRNFSLGGFALLNDFYKFLGIKQTTLGDEIGWTVSNGDIFWIDFDHYKAVIDGRECFVIDAVWEPTDEYIEYYA